MPQPQDLQHIFYFGQGSSSPYKGKGNGPRKFFGMKDRQQHGQKLLRDFRSAWQQAQLQRQMYPAAVIQDKQGVLLEFEIAPGFEDVLKSLDARGSKIELRSFRSVVAEDDLPQKFATVFIPDGQESVFNDKFDDYLNVNKDKTSKNGIITPKHQSFVESLEQIRLAILQSFWTDHPELFPQDETARIWWEVWLSTTIDDDMATFLTRAAENGLAVCSTPFSAFPERKVGLLEGSLQQMQSLLEQTDQIAELRRAKDAEFFLEQRSFEQREWEAELANRVQFIGNHDHSICILDSGINRSSKLIQPFLRETDVHVYDPKWLPNDQHGHGTAMAGLVLYGDLGYTLARQGPIEIPYHLESVKMMPPSGFLGVNKPEFSAMTVESVARVEITADLSHRVFCMAIASKDGRERGKPSLWSASVDQLVAGIGNQPKRLFVLAAGNQSLNDTQAYPGSNLSEDIHDPGQAWNSLTIGAYTNKTDITESDYRSYQAIAPAGDLCPTSSTSMTWLNCSPQRSRLSKKWPNKPDLVLEGGNYALDPSGQNPTWLDSLSLISLDQRAINGVFTTMRDTSAATAQAARMSAYLWAAYPDLWPETIRALLIHSAEWTQAMWNRVRSEWSGATQREHLERLLCMYGFGVPQLPKALWSAQNRLVMVVQDSLQPYKKERGKSVSSFNEMHLQRLPWPLDVLHSLGETQVQMRVTLSYFIEPSPGNRGFSQRYLYASHGLRFEVKTPEESEEQFRKRVNPSEDSETDANTQEWLLGPTMRHRGSIHSDIWSGTAADLASRGMIAVYPVAGWWKERAYLGRWGSQARYALVVSIETPSIETDIYTPVKIQTQVSVEV